MVIITVGEMIVMPVSMALAARFAPEDMRGRYMSIYGLSWGIASGISAPMGWADDTFKVSIKEDLKGQEKVPFAQGFCLDTGRGNA